MTTYKCSVELGDRVKHRISGFTGIVQCISFWLNGCARVSVHPEKLEKGKVPDSFTFDDVELVTVKRGAFAVSVSARDTGGPRPGPVQRRDPR